MLGKDGVVNGYYGQEINVTTYNLCRINMFLHDIGYQYCSETQTDEIEYVYTILYRQHITTGKLR